MQASKLVVEAALAFKGPAFRAMPAGQGDTSTGSVHSE